MAEQAVERRPLAGLTSLRFFAASYVLLFHTRGGVFFRAGYTGVTLFFVLSGFILAYNHPQIQIGQRGRFYISRFARIYPLYLLSFFLMLPFFLQSAGPITKGHLALSSFLYLTLLQTWVPPFHFIISPGSWTLSVEMFFYAVFPFVVSWFGRLRQGWMVTVGLLWAMLLTPSIVADFLWIPMYPATAGAVHAFFYLPIFHVGEFFIGIVLGLQFLRHRPAFRGITVFGALVLCIAFLAAIGMLPGARYNELALNGMMALPFGLLIYTIAGWPSRILAHPLLQIGGEISYGIYLLQWVFVYIVQSIFHHARAFLPIRFGLFLVFAYITYQLVEKPARKLILRLFKIKSHPKPIETETVVSESTTPHSKVGSHG